jgi:hypothetical protein
MNWTQLAQDRDQWGAFCEHGNEFSGFHKMLGKFLVAERLLASQEGVGPI